MAPIFSNESFYVPNFHESLPVRRTQKMEGNLNLSKSFIGSQCVDCGITMRGQKERDESFDATRDTSVFNLDSME